MGHRVAGELAAQYLNDTTAQKIRELLGNETLAEASVWADNMRSDPSPFWQKEAPHYHFVTVPPGRSYSEIGAPPQGDAVTALAMFRRQLRDPHTSETQKQLALRFALHIVQDLQQPLHTGNGRDKGVAKFRSRWGANPRTFTACGTARFSTAPGGRGPPGVSIYKAVDCFEGPTRRMPTLWSGSPKAPCFVTASIRRRDRLMTVTSGSTCRALSCDSRWPPFAAQRG